MPFDVNLQKYTFPTPVKILMLVGQYTDPALIIDTTIDKNLIRNLPGAKPQIVEATSIEEVIEALDNNEFDILIFAGHSTTLNDGSDAIISLTDTLSITIEQIQNEIRNALNRRSHPLVLAIFNSCDGLGIDSRLTSLRIKIPYLIAMRERITDPIAHRFLKLFLRYFVKRRMSLERAYKQAQNGLHSLFPGADFLPILCLKQAMMPDLFWPVNIAIFISQLWRNKIARYVGLTIITILAVLLSYIIIKILIQEPREEPVVITTPFQPVVSQGFITHCKQTQLHISCGEKSLFEDSPLGNKKLGIDAFEAGNYDDAVKNLENAFNQDSQNYETGIFLENAKALQLKKAKENLQIFPVAVVIPTIDKNKNKKEIYSVSKATIQGVYNQQKYFNDSKQTNNRLLVVIANDKNDPGKPIIQNGKQTLQDGQSQLVAKELIKRNILAIVGPYSSKVAYYTNNIYKDQEIVVMSYASTATKTTYKEGVKKKDITPDLTKNNPYFFRVCSKNTEIAKVLADNFDSRQYDKLMLFFDDKNIFSGSFGQEFNKHWKSIDQKNQIIMQEYLGNIEPEKLKTKIDDKIKSAQNKNIGIVLCPGAYTQVNNATNTEEKDIQNAKYILGEYGKQLLIGGCNVVNTYQDTIDEKLKNHQKNIIVSVPWFYDPNNTTKKFDTWKSKWEEQKVNFKTDSFMRMVLAQDATMVLTEALSKLDGKPSGSKLQKYLVNPENKFQGITGEISFGGSDRRTDTSKVITPKCEQQECSNWNGEWEIVKDLPESESLPRPL
jgi:ABC-type branched-subunit amino acid transport system substrate-binding protein